jgi:hypothetical protein
VRFPSKTDWLDPGSVLPPNSVTFFNHGSLFDGRTGAGVYSEYQNTGEAFSLGTQATVFQSEVYAILMSSEHCRNLQLRD